MVINHHNHKKFEIDTFMSEIKLISDGNRTVALITDGDDPHLEMWRMVESDDPAVAAFVEQMVAAAKAENTGSKLYQRP